MAKTCYQKRFVIDYTNFTNFPQHTIIQFFALGISDLRSSDSCFWCGDNARPANHEKPLDKDILLAAVIKDLKNDSSSLYENLPLVKLYKSNGGGLFERYFNPTEDWVRISQSICSSAVCSEVHDVDVPVPSVVPRKPPPSPSRNADAEQFCAIVNIKKGENRIRIHLITGDKSLPKAEDLNTLAKLGRYMKNKTYPVWLKGGSFEVTVIEPWEKIPDE